MTIQPIKYAIFDNDGVNMDSETIAMGVAAKFGYELVTQYDGGTDLKQDAIYRTYKGVKTSEIMQRLIKGFCLPYEAIKQDYKLGDIPDDQVATALAAIVTEATNQAFIDAPLKAIPHIGEALREVDALIGGQQNRALCTTSPVDRMNISLAHAVDPATGENAGLAELYPDEGDRRISGYEYTQGSKYQYFMTLHPDLDPKTAVIIEDSESGVGYAKKASADFRVIGTAAAEFFEDKRDQTAKLLQAGADIVVQDARDIPKAIEWMNNGMNMNAVPNFIAEVHHNNALIADTRILGKSPSNQYN